MYSIETTSRIQELRNKQREGTLTTDEMREAISLMRQERKATPIASGGSKAKKAKPVVNGDELLAQLL